MKAAALILLVCISFSPAFSAGFVWDDFAYLVSNESLRSARGLVQIWTSPDPTTQYYPLVFTSFWIEHHLWGDAPLGYHVVNVVLHVVSVFLLVLLLSRWRLGGAWLAAALFAIHPVQVQSVVWISERKNVVSGIFFLMALLAWQSFSATRSRRAYLVCVGASVLALLGKAALAPLPLVLLVLRWWETGRIRRDALVAVAPIVAVALGVGAHHAWLEASNVADFGRVPDMATRVVVAGRALWFYLGTFLWPVDLVPIYPKWHLDPSAMAAWAWPIAALSLPVVLYNLRRTAGRGPLFAAVYFGLMLAPALGLVQQGINRFTDVALHFEYLAILAPIVVTAELVSALASRGRALRAAVWSVTAIALGALTMVTHHHAEHYQSVETLFAYNARTTPTSWGPPYFLARRAAWEGHADESIRLYRRALELAPWSADATSELADVYVSVGRPQQAIETLQSTLREHGPQPVLLNQLAAVLDQVGRPSEARVALEAALAQAPGNSQYRANLGKVCLDLDDYSCAEENLRLRLGDAAADVEAQTRLADVLRKTSRLTEALELYRSSLAVSPDQPTALFGAGESLAALDRTEESAEVFVQLTQLSPGTPLVWRRLGEVLAQLSRDREAEAALREALRLKPDYTEAYLSLARVAERQGDLASATWAVRRAVASAPGSGEAHLELARLLRGSGAVAEAEHHLGRARELQPGSSSTAAALAAAGGAR